MTEQEKTLRDRFAMAAMQALLSDYRVSHYSDSYEDICNKAYLIADAMLKVRKL